MTDTEQAPLPPGTTAGALLRAAREKQGVHIAVLAAAIKISPRKLDALEGDRYAELPDATFTRALAQTVCRALKIDSAPVMALLPTAEQKTLDAVGEGLNTPFRDRSPGADLGALLPRAPLVWAGLALLAAAALVYYWPARTPIIPTTTTTSSVPAVAASPTSETLRGDAAAMTQAAASAASSFADAAASAAQAGVAGASPVAAVPSPSTAASGAVGVPDQSARPANLPATVMPSATGATVAVSEPVWLEVTDASGQVVFQRTIQPGETLTFDQSPPLRLKIGNSAAAKLTFRGEPVDLNTFTRGNVARVTLK